MPHHDALPSGCSIEIVAHRGASIEAPENTLAAVELAWQLHADAVEIDVQLTRDGRLAVIHDATLLRTAGVDQLVCDVDLFELRTIDVGSWKDARWRGETIPELPNILATIPDGRRLFVELKGGDNAATHPAIVSALQRDLAGSNSAPKSIVLISFHPALLRAAKQALPEFDAFLVVQQEPVLQDSEAKTATNESVGNPSTKSWQPSIEEIIDVAVSSGFNGVDLSNTAAVTPEAIGHVQQAKLASCIWTVNSIDDARRLITAGVNSLTTDDPKTLISALKLPSEL
ncbi:MAG: glycerophosphodiester phosphodiesterase family protein [Planctomycetota bacterium]|nr:glycerophosphodiester phosphodiesterase family protein [Planctomycetota bacterium]MDA1161443.1 glycerophosphodiester phosphodiesterase family protein [Planctomycetota bacterium]